MARSARAGLVSMNLLFNKEKRDRFAFAHVYRHELFSQRELWVLWLCCYTGFGTSRRGSLIPAYYVNTPSRVYIPVLAQVREYLRCYLRNYGLLIQHDAMARDIARSGERMTGHIGRNEVTRARIDASASAE